MKDDPETWDITIEEAARIVLGNDFIARSGEVVLDAVELAQRMDHVWSLVDVECAVCGHRMSWSAAMVLGQRGDSRESRCWKCSGRLGAEWQVEVFNAYGLIRGHREYVPFGEKVAARCMECGDRRNISITDLFRGIAPCLRCIDYPDPGAPHRVYLMHFPGLRDYKIGITGTEARHDRVSVHLARGGVLIELHEVPNQEAARTVENYVLSIRRDFPGHSTLRDFPQGGYTETWSDDAPPLDLEDIVERMRREEAPGFDRLSKLKSYFQDEPPTIEEMLPFRRIETIETDGEEVHCVGLSEPMEQVLGKIRRSRESAAG